VNSFAHAPAVTTTNDLWTMIGKFAAWLDNTGYATYDPYDVWGTRYGKWARRLYYDKHFAGVFLTAPLVLMEIACPRLRQFFVKKDRYATADAQLALAFLNLHEVCENERSEGETGATQAQSTPFQGSWLSKARKLADDLLKESVPGYSGPCWGYPFDWQNVNGLMPKGTPHITATPYCYEVFIRLFDLTGEHHYLELARSVMAFVSEDLNDTPTGPESAASSYTPYDRGKVVNASAYRAFLLFDAAQRFSNEAYQAKGWKNLRFILESQEADGSWLYAIGDPAEAFIDHFHTCFVLKNLCKINRQLKSAEVRETIARGYAWYRRSMFDAEDNPKTYAIAPRLEIVRLEMYNVAEAITLGALLRHDCPGAFSLARSLSTRLLQRYQLSAGYWVTRVYRGGVRHSVPFLRWPQSQLFLAVTNLLVSERGRRDRSGLKSLGHAEQRHG